ncbi:CASP-like protein 4D1 [Magnolia sinica]|uniref:CASP-like protein 4D1 n=1 Tax=Magnolia sinica TaxID=86752 RepID=UPI002658AA16|nr:CASP-like protein 4D1 [Magnolia sinica]
MASSNAMAITTLTLRLLALGLLAASVAVLATDRVTFDDGTKATFKDIVAYRFVISTGAIGFAYALFQIPFAVYHVSTGKQMIRNECLPEFDFYGDKIIAFLLATGVGAGFAVSFEFKKLIRDFIDSFERLGVPGLTESESKLDKFLDRANIATGLLFLAFLCMAALSVLSSLKRTPSSNGFFG